MLSLFSAFNLPTSYICMIEKYLAKQHVTFSRCVDIIDFLPHASTSCTGRNQRQQQQQEGCLDIFTV
jgi:hypothetical protein